MPHPDDSLKALQATIEDFKVFCAAHGSVTEADTRAKVIDRVLKEVCLWPEADLSREDHVERGYIDYCLHLSGKPHIAVEAKRQHRSSANRDQRWG